MSSKSINSYFTNSNVNFLSQTDAMQIKKPSAKTLYPYQQMYILTVLIDQ